MIIFEQPNYPIMKKLLILMLIIAFAGCRKSPQIDLPSTDIENLNIPASFKWETTKNVKLLIYSEFAKLMTITSSDQAITYHKGYFNREAEAYAVSLSLPAFVESLRVNGQEVALYGLEVDVRLDAGLGFKQHTLARQLPDGLVAYWPFDENEGEIVADYAGNANGAQIAGEWSPGIQGSALQFDGSATQVEIPYNQDLNFTNNALGVSLWFSRTAAETDADLFFYRNKFLIRIDRGGKITFATYNPSWNKVVTAWSDRVIDNVWHHLGASYDGAELRIYLDGELMATSPNTGNLQASSGNLLIGSQTSKNYFSGFIDEVMLFDRALSGSEFQQIIDETNNPGTGENLIASWPLDEGSGIIVGDETGSHHGTAENVAWVEGVSGSACDFNGSNSNINISNHPDFDVYTELSIMAWVNTRENKTTKIAQKGDWDGHGLGQGKWDGFNAHIRSADQHTHTVRWGNGLPVFDQWYHLAMSYDGQTLRLFVNGQLVNEKYIGQNLHINNRHFSIGSDNGAQKHFNGMIDEVKFFGKALQPIEIQALMNQAPDLNDSDGDGIPDEDDDFPNDPSRAFVNYYPAAGYASLAFEDLWPGRGDYDFNDLVTDYRFSLVTNGRNKLTEVLARFIVRANGAGLQNGFGFQLPGSIPLADVQAEGYQLTEDYIQLTDNGLEAGQDLLTVIVFDNIKSILQSASGFGANVMPGAPWVEPDTIDIALIFKPNSFSLDQLDLEGFNPFLIVDKNRGHEIHLPDFAPSALADLSLFGATDDDSDPSSGRYYKSRQNLPWAIQIASPFDYTIESAQIIQGHLKFSAWAESGGAAFPDWYLDHAGYRDMQHIYSKP